MTPSPTLSAKEWTPPPDPEYDLEAESAYERFMEADPKAFAFDTETSGFLLRDRAFCVTVGWNGPDGVDGGYFELTHYNSRPLLREMFAGRQLIGHNLKFDLHRALQEGIIWRDKLDPKGLHDTECMAHLLDEHRPKGLKPLMVSVLGEEDLVHVPTEKNPDRWIPREKYEMDLARRKLKLKAGDGFDKYPRGVVAPYAVKDATATMELFNVFVPQLMEYEDLTRLYRQEMELSLVYLDMEYAGLGVNLQYVDDQIVALTGEVLDVEERIAKVVGKPVESAITPTPKEFKGKWFNPSSNPQLQAYFKERDHVYDSYNKDVLKQIDDPLAELILEMRRILKLRSTYFIALREGTTDGVFHPSIRQHGTVTGRTSSGREKGDA